MTPDAEKAGQIRVGQIYVGIGGWTFEPWRGVFYPQSLPHAKELSYAAERLTSIEVNGTFYRSQTPATFRKWASEVPAGFVFALKGPRFAVNRRVLKDAGNSIKRFLDSGVTELGDHLGPLLWQFAPTKKFDAADFGGFLELLPDKYEGRVLRHVIEVRHDSFCTPEFMSLLRRFAMPAVYTDHVKYPNIADITGDFVYARLQHGKDYASESLPSQRDQRMGRAPEDLGAGQNAGRPAAHRSGRKAKDHAARRVCLCDPRGQSARAGRRDGAHRADNGGRMMEDRCRTRTMHPSSVILPLSFAGFCRLNANGHVRHRARTSGVTHRNRGRPAAEPFRAQRRFAGDSGGAAFMQGRHCARLSPVAMSFWSDVILVQRQSAVSLATQDLIRGQTPGEWKMTLNQPNDVAGIERALESALRKHWVLFLVEGIVLLVLGIAAILLPVIATITFTILIGWLFLISGGVGLATTLWMRHAPGFWWSLLSALIGIVAGILLLLWPMTGSLSLTLVLSAFFIVEGVASIMYAIEHRNQLSGRWGWMLLSGIVDLILAGIIIAGLPGSALWALGLLVGINLIFGGVAMIGMALAARQPA